MAKGNKKAFEKDGLINRRVRHPGFQPLDNAILNPVNRVGTPMNKHQGVK